MITPTMERMAVAVLRGDEAAALALADALQEGRVAGERALPPVTRFTSDASRLRIVAFASQEYATATPEEMAGSGAAFRAWLGPAGGVLWLPPSVERIELYELPARDAGTPGG